MRFAVILTSHAYSAAEHYQVLVPILPGDGMHTAESVVRAAGQPWIRVLGPHVSTALLVVPALESVWHHAHIDEPADDGGPPLFIDQATLDEERVAALFTIQR